MADALCAECHADIIEQHAHSMHRLSSFNNPAYLALRCPPLFPPLFPPPFDMSNFLCDCDKLSMH